MSKTLWSAGLVLLLAVSTAQAQHAPTKIYSGEQVKKATEKVMDKIGWVNDLTELKKKAQADNKLIFWMQIVGDLDGGL